MQFHLSRNPRPPSLAHFVASHFIWIFRCQPRPTLVGLPGCYPRFLPRASTKFVNCWTLVEHCQTSHTCWNINWPTLNCTPKSSKAEHQPSIPSLGTKYQLPTHSADICRLSRLQSSSSADDISHESFWHVDLDVTPQTLPLNSLFDPYLLWA